MKGKTGAGMCEGIRNGNGGLWGLGEEEEEGI